MMSPSEELAAGGIFEKSFEDEDGVISGQNKRRVHAGQKRAGYKEAGEIFPVGERKKGWGMDISAGEFVEEGGDHEGDADGEGQGDEVEEEAFDEELTDQVGAERAEDFPDADFACAFEGACRGEVDIIYPGDRGDEESDHEEKGDGAAVPVCFGFFAVVGVEVDIG